jgi:hypothetical protein
LLLRIVAWLILGSAGVTSVLVFLPLVTIVLAWRLRDGRSFADAYGANYNKILGLGVGFETRLLFGSEQFPEWDDPRNSHLTIAYNQPTVGGILIRYLTVIPHAIFYWVISILVFFALIVSAVTALSSGSVPDWAQSLFRGVVQCQALVPGYFIGPVDPYPPFSLEEPATLQRDA